MWIGIKVNVFLEMLNCVILVPAAVRLTPVYGA